MHDNTDIRLMRPADPRLQRALYSRYYAGCIAKGGVAVQPCGWIATWELCTGAVDDLKNNNNIPSMMTMITTHLPIFLTKVIVLS